MYIKFFYIPIKRTYKTNKGLSEKLIKNRLIKQGWEVWRGGFLHATRREEIYSNVESKYRKLDFLSKDKLEYLQYLSRIHHGMPDFFCKRYDEYKFVECKLGNEQLAEIQKKCIKILILKGFKVEVHKLAFHSTKIREAIVNIYSNEKQIIEKQERLKLRY